MFFRLIIPLKNNLKQLNKIKIRKLHYNINYNRNNQIYIYKRFLAESSKDVKIMENSVFIKLIFRIIQLIQHLQQ